MPWLKDITYSRETTITALQEFYEFLSQMYLPPNLIRSPPITGWPEITTSSLAELQKSNEVINLLRALPYLNGSSSDPPQGAPRCQFADWATLAEWLTSGGTDSESVKITSEGPDFLDSIPGHVVSLTCGGRDNPVFLLDTHLGVVYWLDCPDEIRNPLINRLPPPPCEQILDEVEDYCSSENEVEWRASGSDTGVWAISDFFEVLKHHFRQLHFYPVPKNKVELVWGWQPNEKREVTREIVQRVYRERGWAGEMGRFDKVECMEAVKEALRERFPDGV